MASAIPESQLVEGIVDSRLLYVMSRSQTSWVWLETKLVELGMVGSDRSYKVCTNYSIPARPLT